MVHGTSFRFKFQTAKINSDRHTPRKRSIQYADAFVFDELPRIQVFKQPIQLRIVIASGAKQSISPRNGRMDCFATLAMTWNSRYDFATPRRDAPEALLNRSPKEGVGNAGCPLHPRPPGFRFAPSGLRCSPTLLREATCPP